MTRERIIAVLAEQIMLALEKLFEPSDMDFALEEIISACRLRRSRSATGRYHQAFDEEPPTRPESPQAGGSDRPALQRLTDSVKTMKTIAAQRESARHNLSGVVKPKKPL